MKRFALLLGLLLVPMLALAQPTPPAPNYSWVNLVPQSGTPATASNGSCWVQGTSGFFCKYNGVVNGPFLASGGAASLVIGSSSITGGASGQVLYDTGGLLGEYTAAQLTAQINVFSNTLSGAVPSSGGGTANFLRADHTWAVPPGTATGTVTTTGTPASGNLTKFSGTSSITNGDLSGDATTSGTLAVTVSKTGGVAFAASATTDTTNAANISSGTLAAARGGAGTITGALKGNGSGLVSQAACGDLSNGATGCSTATGTSGATLPLLNGTNVWSGQQSVTPVSISSGTATITPTGGSNNYTATLVHANCPCTLANPSATPVAGTGGQIVVIQSASGSDLISTWGSDYEASGGTSTLVLSTGANAVDVLSYYVRDSTHIELSLLTNFSH